jgi:hypothetical protein
MNFDNETTKVTHHDFGSMTEQEQAEFCERNHLAVQQIRSQQAA